MPICPFCLATRQPFLTFPDKFSTRLLPRVVVLLRDLSNLVANVPEKPVERVVVPEVDNEEK